jgi:hypothetical protein
MNPSQPTTHAFFYILIDASFPPRPTVYAFLYFKVTPVSHHNQLCTHFLHFNWRQFSITTNHVRIFYILKDASFPVPATQMAKSA